MSKKSLVRKNILGMQPYLPGKPIKEVERELGIKDIVKIASNENSFSPPKLVIDAIKRELSSLNRYPEGSGIYLRQALSRKLGVPEDYIILGNGTDEIIELIGKTFVDKGDEIVVSEVVSVIAREDDERVLEQVLLLQRSEDPSDLHIDLHDRCRVMRPDFPFVCVCELRVVHPIPRPEVSLDVAFTMAGEITGAGWYRLRHPGRIHLEILLSTHLPRTSSPITSDGAHRVGRI